MPEAILCPKCGKGFPFQAALAGKRVKCNACGHVFSVAAPATPPVEDSSKKTPKASLPEAIPVAQARGGHALAATAATAAAASAAGKSTETIGRPAVVARFDGAGVLLPSAAALKSKRRAAASLSAGGSQVADFIIARPLMVAVVAAALVAAVVLADLWHTPSTPSFFWR